MVCESVCSPWLCCVAESLNVIVTVRKGNTARHVQVGTTVQQEPIKGMYIHTSPDSPHYSPHYGHIACITNTVVH